MGTIPRDVATLQQNQKFVEQKHCEIVPELDYCALQSYSQCPRWSPATLAHLWLSRLLFSAGEEPETFLALYKKAANGRSFQEDVTAGYKTTARLEAALRPVQLGAATPRARCGQWKKGSCKQQAAKLLAELIASKQLQRAAQSITNCTSEDQVNDVLEKKLHVRQRFLRYLLYHDLRQYFPKLPESRYVGKEAQAVLKEATALMKKSSLEKRLEALTAHLKGSLPKKLVAILSQRGWQYHHTGGRKRARDSDREMRQQKRLRMVQ